MDAKEHWENVYAAKSATEVSWYQAQAKVSLSLIQQVASEDSAIIDVGGGASTLVDGLMQAGFRSVAVLDIANTALDASRRRLGDPGRQVQWIVANILEFPFQRHSIDVWHDRAVFHFLTSSADRRQYVQQVVHAIRPGGHVIVGTFAEDGPEKCSGLDVCRYSPSSLHAEFGEPFLLKKSVLEEHVTPWGKSQRFQYCLCRMIGI